MKEEFLHPFQFEVTGGNMWDRIGVLQLDEDAIKLIEANVASGYVRLGGVRHGWAVRTCSAGMRWV